jgi:hypothetical protein
MPRGEVIFDVFLWTDEDGTRRSDPKGSLVDLPDHAFERGVEVGAILPEDDIATLDDGDEQAGDDLFDPAPYALQGGWYGFPNEHKVQGADQARAYLVSLGEDEVLSWETQDDDSDDDSEDADESSDGDE